MRFKKFFYEAEQLPGAFITDDPRPTGSGRQQEMPGSHLVMGDEHADGKIIAKEVKGKKDDERVILTISDVNADEIDLWMPYTDWSAKGEEAPKVGDTVGVDFRSDKSIKNIKPYFSDNDVSVSPVGTQSPTGSSTSFAGPPP